MHCIHKHYGQPQCGLVLPLEPSEEEEWSDRNLSVENPPNPQSLETLQTLAEVVQFTSQSSLSSVQWVGLAADYLLKHCPIVKLSVCMYDGLVLCPCGCN